jgi:hypothetical protein
MGEGTVLLFDPVLEATSISIGDLYRRLDAGLRASEVIIFRGTDSNLIDAIEKDPLLESNLSGKAVMALVGAITTGATAPSLVPIKKFPAPPRPPIIEDLRTAELTAILQRAQAIFASDEYHYELPSGFHAEKFVRLADALRSVYDVRRITDWLVPYLEGDTVIIADTGSMLPLLLDLREQVGQRFGWNIEISTLDRYPQDSVAVSDAIAAVRNRPAVVNAAATDSKLGFLFLISVNSSGRLCRLFRKLGPQNGKIVVVCETSGQPSPCDDVLVTVPITRWEVASDGLCERCNTSPTIRVHPESYELLPSIKREQVKVDKNLAQGMAEFWKIADAADAVQLHVDVPYAVGGQQDYRHFGVYLNTAKLAAYSPFRESCLAQLRQIEAPDIVLIPEHQTCRIVASLCSEAHSSAAVHIVPPGRLPESIYGHLAKAKRVLVADDAIVTGITLLNLRTEVFRVTQQLGVTPEVNAFVIVSRPSGPEPLKALRMRYHGKSVTHVLAGVQLFLPEGKNCPWCHERKLLTSFRPQLKGDALTAAQQRIRKLEAPVLAPLLIVPPHDARDDLLTQGSVFGPLRQPAAFAAGVSAAQRVIHSLGTLGGGIQLKVVDLEMAIDAYYEGVLLASLLRTFKPVHVRYPGSDPKVEAAILRLDPQRAYPGVLAELALAAIANKIPSRHVRQLVETQKAQDASLLMLATLMDEVGAT